MCTQMLAKGISDFMNDDCVSRTCVLYLKVGCICQHLLPDTRRIPWIVSFSDTNSRLGVAKPPPNSFEK